MQGVHRREASSDWFERWSDMLACEAGHTAWEWWPSARDGEDAPHGELRCKACGRSLLVEDGIVRHLQIAHLADTAQAVEIAARDAAADGYEASVSKERHEREVAACIEALAPRSTDVIVELGCGTGRLLRRYAARTASVVATDFSLASLRCLARALPPEQRRRCLLVHADIASVPLRAGIADKLACFQVLEHLPTPELRTDVVRRFTRLLVGGGSLTCTVYHWSARKRRLAKKNVGDNTQKEGRHETGIYYYNFDVDEVRELFETAGFELDALEGIDVRFRGMRWLGPYGRSLADMTRRTSFGRRHAELLLAHARLPRVPRASGSEPSVSMIRALTPA